MVVRHDPPGRDIWIPEFDLTPINTMGSEWPDAIIVERWEHNQIGERRWVDTEMYYHNPMGGGQAVRRPALDRDSEGSTPSRPAT